MAMQGLLIPLMVNSMLSITVVQPACQNPFPVGALVEVFEDAPIGSNVLDLGPSQDIIWSLSVREPASYSSQLVTYFTVTSQASRPNWLLVLDKQLDLEKIYADYNLVLEVITLSLICQNTKTGMQVPYSGFIAVTPVSEFAPVFLPRALVQEVPEDAEINSEVFDLRPMVSDADVNGGSSNMEEFYSTPSSDNLPDGQAVFDVASDGKVRLLRSLDFDEGERVFSLNVSVKDIGGLSSHAIIRLNVRNSNDNSPVFDFSGCTGQNCALAEYKATVDPQYTGPLASIAPNAIQAHDADADPISYRFISGSPVNFSSYLQVDSITGVVILSQPVADLRFGHFSVIVEAMDINQTMAAGGASTVTAGYNSATCILLILVAGRETEFPAVIGQSTSSSDRDSLFISTICLATFCAVILILFLALVIWLCCLRRNRQKLNEESSSPHHQQSKKTQSSKTGNALMRSVHSDSERRFMRDLSASDVRAGKDNPAYQDANVFFETQSNARSAAFDDDVFVTDMESYFNLQGILQSTENRPTRRVTPEVIAFQDALPSGGDQLISAVPYNLDELDNSVRQNGNTAQALNPRNLQSQYKAIDLLTTVVPLNEVGSRPPFSSFLNHDGQLKDVTPASSSAGTCRSVRSMRDASVKGELEDLVPGRSAPSHAAPPSSPTLPAHLHGYLPDEFDTRNPLDEALTPFPGSPSGQTTSPSLSVEQNTSQGSKLNSKYTNPNVDGNINNVERKSFLGSSSSTPALDNRFTSSLNIMPQYSLTKNNNVKSLNEHSGLNVDTRAPNTTVGDLPPKQHSLSFEPSQSTTNSVPKIENQNFFTISF